MRYPNDFQTSSFPNDTFCSWCSVASGDVSTNHAAACAARMLPNLTNSAGRGLTLYVAAHLTACRCAVHWFHMMASGEEDLAVQGLRQIKGFIANLGGAPLFT